MRSYVREFLVLSPLLALIVLFFFRLFYPEPGLFMIPDYGLSDVLHLNLPLKDFLSHSLKAGEWPLWNPRIGTGFPILAEGQIGALSLMNMLLFRYLETVIAYNISLLVTFLIAGTGTYMFCRMLRVGKPAALFGAITFTFCGFFSVHLNHSNLIQTAALLPFLFICTEMLLRRPTIRTSMAFSFIVSQQVFAGYLPIVFISLFGAGIYWLLRIRDPHSVPRMRRIQYAALGLCGAVGLSAIQLFPTYELWQLSARKSGLDFTTVTAFPYPLKHVITFIRPYFFGNPAIGTYPKFSLSWGIFWENTAYIGVVPLLLALSSVVRWGRRRHMIHWICLLGISLLLVPGKYSPFYFVFTFFPFTLFRVPSRFLLLTAFTLVILATYHADWIYTRIISFRRPRRSLIALLCMCLFLLSGIDEYVFSYRYPPVSAARWWMEKPESVSVLDNQATAVGRIAVFTQDIAWNTVFERTGWEHISPYRDFRSSLEANYNSMFGISQVDVYTGGLLPRRTIAMKQITKSIRTIEHPFGVSVIPSTAAATLLSLAHTTHLLSPDFIESPGITHVATIAASYTKNAVHIYANTQRLPRPFLVYETKQAQTMEDLMQTLTTMSLSKPIGIVEEEALVFSPSNNATGSAHIIEEQARMIRLEVQTTAPAMLILADTYYPGWYASLNGIQVPIYPVNINARGITIPSGVHTLTFSYEPASFEIGKRVTYATMILMAVCCFFSSVKRRSTP